MSLTTPKKAWSPLAVVLALSAGFFVLFLIVSGFLYSMKSSEDWDDKGPKALFSKATGSVGVIELTGVIISSKKILKQLEKFEKDTKVKAVVLRLNSPGGAVAPSQEIYEAVKKYSKPVIASMGSVAASGAYYVACGAKTIFANPGTITGSIGVIMTFANFEKLYEWAKIQRYSVKTGKFKDTGAEYKPMGAEERELLQGMIDDVLDQFREAVATGRSMTKNEVERISDGRIFSGRQARNRKLVDELGTIQDAIKFAGKAAGIEGDPKVVYPEKERKRFIQMLFEGAGDDDESDSEAEAAPSRIVRSLAALLGADLPADTRPSLPGVYWLWNGAH